MNVFDWGMSLASRSEDGLVHVIVDTPKGCSNNHKYDPQPRLFKLSRVSPLGLHFPAISGHECRKQTKHFANQLAMIPPLAPKLFAKSHRRAQQRADCLGDDFSQCPSGLSDDNRPPRRTAPRARALTGSRPRVCEAVAFNDCMEAFMQTNYVSRDTYGMYKSYRGSDGPGPALMGADTLLGNDVYNGADENLGTIKEFMIDMAGGRIAYAVLSFGGFLGMGDRLFAVPWQALQLDTAKKRFTLAVSKDKLKNAPGFDKDHWPSMADPGWATEVHSFYGVSRAYDSPTSRTM